MPDSVAPAESRTAYRTRYIFRENGPPNLRAFGTPEDYPKSPKRANIVALEVRFIPTVSPVSAARFAPMRGFNRYLPA